MTLSFLMRVNESESKEDALKFIIKISQFLTSWLTPVIKVRADEIPSYFPSN
jgi:hypothetical protein